MHAEALSLPLDDEEPSYAGVVVNARCQLLDDGGIRVVMFAGLPVFRFAADDREAEDLFIAQALENHYARPGELAAALGRPLRTVLDAEQTVHRVRQRYVQGGLAGLLPEKRGPKGPRMGARREAVIRRWHREGLSVAEMARRLGVSWSTVQAALRRMGLDSGGARAKQLALVESGAATGGEVASSEEPDGEASVGAEHRAVVADEAEVVGEVAEEPEGGQLAPPPVPSTLDTDPADRRIDRMLAARGMLEDAAPLFAASEAVPRAGVLLAVPLLVDSGLFEAASKAFGTIKPAFYGLRTTLLTLVLLALLRIKRPENVKEYSPPELGKVIGLDRAPEVKTIRRKLERLCAFDGQSERFIGALVRRRVERASEALGFLYVDGHVRVYHGKADLPKTHVARVRLSLPATQDVWVNDQNGDPVFFVTQQAHPQLVSALPEVLGEVRELVGAERRVTVVFDRGGWSPKLFKKMVEDKFDVLTYRKGKVEPIPDDQFTSYEVELTGGLETYELHDMSVAVGDGPFWMRQITRRKGNHQTHIVTSRHDLPVVEVARRMFERWRQENFFKYMRGEFAIDALVEHGTEPDDPNRLVPNPERKAVEQKLRKTKQELARLEAAYGAAAVDNPEGKRPTMRGFKIAHGTELGVPLRQARNRVKQLTTLRKALPTKVPVGSIKDEVVRLPMRRKRLSDALKMLAYQVESELVRAVAPHYARSLDEGRRLIRSALKSTADIKPVDGELRITLAPQSSAHRSLAIAQLCQQLNDTHTCFPGTSLRLRYAVKGVDCAT